MNLPTQLARLRVSLLVAGVVLWSLLTATPAHADLIRVYFRSQTNNETLLTNAFTKTAISGNILASGGTIPQGIPTRIYPTSGVTNIYFAPGFHALSNSLLANGIVIRSYTTDNSSVVDMTNRIWSGYNTFAVVGDITINEVGGGTVDEEAVVAIMATNNSATATLATNYGTLEQLLYPPHIGVSQTTGNYATAQNNSGFCYIPGSGIIRAAWIMPIIGYQWTNLPTPNLNVECFVDIGSNTNPPTAALRAWSVPLKDFLMANYRFTTNGHYGMNFQSRYLQTFDRSTNEATPHRWATALLTAPMFYTNGILFRITNNTAGSAITLSAGEMTRVSSTVNVAHNSHGFNDGDYITVSGANQSEYNGTYHIVRDSANAFHYAFAGSATSPATGTIVCTPSTLWRHGYFTITYESGAPPGPYWNYRLRNLRYSGTISGANDASSSNYLGKVSSGPALIIGKLQSALAEDGTASLVGFSDSHGVRITQGGSGGGLFWELNGDDEYNATFGFTRGAFAEFDVGVPHVLFEPNSSVPRAAESYRWFYQDHMVVTNGFVVSVNPLEDLIAYKFNLFYYAP